MSNLSAKLARATAVPMTLRAICFVAALTGLLLVKPAQVTEPGVILLLVAIATLPALQPDSSIVTVVMGVMILGWVVVTVGLDEAISLPRVLGISISVYLVHAAAAMAAALPYDAIVDAQVVLRWAARTALVVCASTLVTVVVLAIMPSEDLPPSLLALLGGLAVVAAVVTLLSRMGRTRS